MNRQKGDGPLMVAIVTGGHTFDVPAFRDLWRDLPGVDAYVQSMEDWADDVAKVRDQYDVTVFYGMPIATPTGQEPWPARRNREALEALGATTQGILVLHHAIVAYPEWSLWGEIVGVKDRRTTVAFNETMHVRIADPAHAITASVAPFDIIDETYANLNPDASCHALLTTDHPKSMPVIAWTRAYREARVFCLQLGHDGQAWRNDGFRTVLRRGIEWCAGRA